MSDPVVLPKIYTIPSSTDDIMTATKTSHLLPPIDQHLIAAANRRRHQKSRVSNSNNGFNASTFAVMDASNLDVTNQDFVFIDSPENWPVNLSPIPVKKRSTRDFFFALLFLAFVGFLGYSIAIEAIEGRADPGIVINGYDNYGNICGQENKKIANVSESGRNMTSKKYLMITLMSNITLRTSCVSKCPRSDFLITAFNRCLPRESPIKLPLIVFEAFNVSRTVIESIVSDVAICWKEITYSASVSFLISLIVLLLLRYVASIVIWISLLSLLVASALATAYTWLKWRLQRVKLDSISATNPLKIDQEMITNQWFIGALVATILWVTFVLVILVMRKRIHLASTLLREAGKAIGSMPLLLLQPFWTFSILTTVSFAWLVGLIYLQSVRHVLIDDETGFVVYHQEDYYKYLKWYHIFAILWIFHFLIACQHFIIASSVSKWYFTRLKNDLDSPIMSSYWILVRYHFGSLALGSLFVSSVKMVRLLFKKLELFVSRHSQDSCTGCIRVCRCCLWFIEKFIIYINNNAYIEMALSGKSFCSSARRAFTVLSCNALRVAAVNSVGDFLLFLSKVLIVLITLVIGVKLVEEREPLLNYTWSPLLVSGLSAYFVAHCFLSVYEMAIDTLLICFCEDNRMNDGHDRPYFMSGNLLYFIKEEEEKRITRVKSMK